MKFKFNDRKFDLAVSSILGVMLIIIGIVLLITKTIDSTAFLGIGAFGASLLFWKPDKKSN